MDLKYIDDTFITIEKSLKTKTKKENQPLQTSLYKNANLLKTKISTKLIKFMQLDRVLLYAISVTTCKNVRLQLRDLRKSEKIQMKKKYLAL